MEKQKIDIIVPCYNEEKCITLFYQNIKRTFGRIERYDFNILFIDDGSRDNTLKQIKQLISDSEETRIQYFSFSRNFGKEAAIYLGLTKSKAPYVILMDADLQHPPELIPEMISKLEEGHDCCAARRVSRKGDSITRRAVSSFFYNIFNRLTGLKLMPGSTDYRIMTRQVVEAIILLSEKERFTKGIYAWVGFDTEWIIYKDVSRAVGDSKWSLSKLFNYAGGGLIGFATTPLRGVIWLGMVIVTASFIYGIMVLNAALKTPGQRTGYASILLAVLFLGGVIIIILGMLGEYMARIFIEVKNRPVYIVKESNEMRNEEE